MLNCSFCSSNKVSMISFMLRVNSSINAGKAGAIPPLRRPGCYISCLDSDFLGHGLQMLSPMRPERHSVHLPKTSSKSRPSAPHRLANESHSLTLRSARRGSQAAPCDFQGQQAVLQGRVFKEKGPEIENARVQHPGRQLLCRFPYFVRCWLHIALQFFTIIHRPAIRGHGTKGKKSLGRRVSPSRRRSRPY